MLKDLGNGRERPDTDPTILSGNFVQPVNAANIEERSFELTLPRFCLRHQIRATSQNGYLALVHDAGRFCDSSWC
jgi:hypothetical protein